MPRKTSPKQGRRVSVWLPYEADKTSKEIDNLSEFVQIALEQAASIMAFDIVKKHKGITQPAPTPAAVERWNEDHPLDPLTAKRLGKEKIYGTTPSLITGNSALDN